MKEALIGYVSKTDNEKSAIWRNGVFVFDTNILLNLYRNPKAARENLINAMNTLKGNVWLPNRVVLEFGQKRCKTIEEIKKKYDETCDKTIKEMVFQFRCEESDPEIKELEKYLNKWIGKQKENNLHATSDLEDENLEYLLGVFNGKVANMQYPTDKDFFDECDKRIKDRIPPGYKDAEKNGDSKYGDIIIWREIIKYATEQQKDIIFVTNDKKEDWWLQVFGTTIGARPELTIEFYKQTGKNFLIYTEKHFVNTALGKLVNKKGLTEINEPESDNTGGDGLEDEQRMFREREKINQYLVFMNDHMKNRIFFESQANRLKERKNELERIVLHGGKEARMANIDEFMQVQQDIESLDNMIRENDENIERLERAIANTNNRISRNHYDWSRLNKPFIGENAK